MKYIKRIAATVVAFFALFILVFGFPLFAGYYIATGKDLTGWLNNIFPGRF